MSNAVVGEKQKKWTILGQDPDVLLAMWANVVSWCVSTFFPSFLPKLLPKCDQEETTVVKGSNTTTVGGPTRCISIGRPGGMEQLRLVSLKPGIVTMGYNIAKGTAYTPKPILTEQDIPQDCVILRNEAFSVNYADCTIRWGLYESAKQFVGYPIVPGFDIAGTIEKVPEQDPTNDNKKKHNWKVGDRVFGCTLFGAYSSRVLVPSMQLRKIPQDWTIAQAAALPAVSLTALYALSLAGHFPQQGKYSNKAILIHSAAGGVGSMAVQMAKLLGLSPVVGVVGRTAKVEEARSLGCDVVIDKSQQNLWEEARAASPQGYTCILDANGVSTLQDSYDHLAPTGRLIIFGFHSNLPLGRAMLSPLEWIRMAQKQSKMPQFDPMDLTVSNKSVLGFNLSFFADETEIVSDMFDQIVEWAETKQIRCPKVVEMPMNEIANAHDLIQSGKSVGKIVMNTSG
mmetsp:Transcript_17101/g.24070  ORF Transcript_17101/g.24070 Transcript_17101/m.24070 type:complete len:455 (+) Transcript_17101:14-1378(+)